MYKLKFCIAGLTYSNKVGYMVNRKRFVGNIQDPDISWYQTWAEAVEHLPAEPRYFIHPYFFC